MAQSPVARALGPLENIVNVGWPSGFFLLVSAKAIYVSGALGTRHATISLTAAGIAAGGVIVDQKTFQAPAAGLLPPYAQFFGVIRFPRLPSSVTQQSAPLYRVTLAGAEQITNTFNPTPVTLFCGTTTIARSDHYRLTATVVADPPVGQPFDVTDDYTYSFSSPKETVNETGTFITKTSVNSTALDSLLENPVVSGGTSTSAWYIDTEGNYVDTHTSCADIVGDGSGSTATFTEGFQNIIVDVYQRLPTSKILPTIEWTATSLPGDIVEGSGIARFECTVPRFKVGNSHDATPLFDDLPNGDYDFKFVKLLFNTLPHNPNGSVFNAPGTYPSFPGFLRYEFLVANPQPSPVRHLTDPIDLDFNSDVAPPPSTPFST